MGQTVRKLYCKCFVVTEFSKSSSGYQLRQVVERWVNKLKVLSSRYCCVNENCLVSVLSPLTAISNRSQRLWNWMCLHSRLIAREETSAVDSDRKSCFQELQHS